MRCLIGPILNSGKRPRHKIHSHVRNANLNRSRTEYTKTNEVKESSLILNRTNHSERHSSSDEEPLPSPNNSFNRSRRGYRDLGQIILNWKLSFSGENVFSADSFLDKIEYRRRLTEVSDEELLMAMPVLLDGMALRWFDIHEHEFTTWKKFKKELRNRFGDDDFDRRIREQIQVRTQGKDESMDDYLTNLQGFIKHLHDEVPMVEQLDWAHRGLRPKYHQVISRSDFRSFRELSRLGRNWEKQWNVYMREYKPPPPPENSFMKEYAYRSKPDLKESPKKSKTREQLVNAIKQEDVSSIQTAESRPQVNNANPNRANGNGNSGNKQRSDRQTDKTKTNSEKRNESNKQITTNDHTEYEGNDVICFRCNKKGHYQKGCLLPRKFSCYKCKKEGFTIKNCPDCTGNETGKQ